MLATCRIINLWLDLPARNAQNLDGIYHSIVEFSKLEHAVLATELAILLHAFNSENLPTSNPNWSFKPLGSFLNKLYIQTGRLNEKILSKFCF